jgi:hypothetical protein
MQASIKRLDTVPVPDDSSPAKVVKMGNVVELVTMERLPVGGCCIKLNKEEYLDLRTGEVKNFEHNTTRADDLVSVQTTLSNIRALVNTNVTDAACVRWVTLTYADNMTDTERLCSDYQSFWQRFSRWCKRHGFSVPEYISVIEPQGRGAWHVHAFFIWPDQAPFVPNDTLAKLWRQGFVAVKALHDCDNIGAYFSAYLTDMPLDELSKLPDDLRKTVATHCGQVSKDFVDDDGNTKTKSFVKGARLYLYPAGMNIVRHSRKIKLPVVERMLYGKAKKIVSAATETFSRAYEVRDADGGYINTITKAYYNKLRKK